MAVDSVPFIAEGNACSCPESDDDPKQPPARAHVCESGRTGRPSLPDEQGEGGEREMGVGYISKERHDGRKGVHVRAKNDHFRSKMSPDRSILIAFASKGSGSRDNGRLFLSKLSALPDIQRHFASNLPHSASFLPDRGTKGAADRAFAAHFPWKVAREVSFVTLDRGKAGQKPDEVDHFGSKVTRNVEVDGASVFFGGQNRGFEDEVVRSSCNNRDSPSLERSIDRQNGGNVVMNTQTKTVKRAMVPPKLPVSVPALLSTTNVSSSLSSTSSPPPLPVRFSSA